MSLGDVLARLWDELESRQDAQRRTIFQRNLPSTWRADSTLQSEIEAISSNVEVAVLSDTVSEDEFRDWIQDASDADLGYYAVIRGLDRAFAYAHPFASSSEIDDQGSDVLHGLFDRYMATGRYDEGQEGGAVLPRFAGRALGPTDLEQLAHSCANVVRVPAEVWQGIEPQGHAFKDCDFQPRDRRSALEVGCAPMIEDLGELEFEVTGVGGYKITPLTPPSQRGRIETVIERLEETEVQLAVMPELTLNDELVEHWQETLRTQGLARLRWAVIGTGPVTTCEPPGAAPPTSPYNRAVVVEGATGRVLMCQDKRFRFSLERSIRERYELETPERLERSRDVLQEEITTAARTKVVETGIGRVAVLICEDFGRVEEAGPALFRAGVSLVLVPIFSKEILRYRWEEKAAERYEGAARAGVVVSDILAIARAREAAGELDGDPADQPDWWTCMVSPPEDGFGRAAAADDLVILPLRLPVRS
jgi:predicted amidohydrolase